VSRKWRRCSCCSHRVSGHFELTGTWAGTALFRQSHFSETSPCDDALSD
jgi:hypothetical protein